MDGIFADQGGYGVVWQVSLLVWLAPDLVSSFDSSNAVKQTVRLVLPQPFS